MYFNEDRSARGIFDRVAADYDAARPTYPDEFYACMRARLGIADGGCADRVLEIGAGSGQATGDLARMARSLTCIEPGPTFVALLRERFTGLARFSLHQGDYEGFTDSAPFDLVVAASSLHWIPKDVFYGTIHRHLRVGGVFAGMWHQPRFTEHTYAAIETVLRPLEPDLSIPRLDPLELAAFERGFEEFADNRGFADCERRIRTQRRLVPPQVVVSLVWSYLDLSPHPPELVRQARERFSTAMSAAPETHAIDDHFLLAIGTSTGKREG